MTSTLSPSSTLGAGSGGGGKASAKVDATNNRKMDKKKTKKNEAENATTTTTTTTTGATVSGDDIGDDNDNVIIPPPLPDGWTRCQYYNVQKKRFCRQQLPKRKKKSKSKTTSASTVVVVVDDENGIEEQQQQHQLLYCGNHQHLLPNKKRKRIPCPLDPNHYIYEDQREKHVRICNKAKKLKQQQGLYYFSNRINTGGHGQLFEIDDTNPTTSDKDDEKFEWAKRLAKRVIEVHQELFAGGGGVKKNFRDDPSQVSFNDVNNACIPLIDLSQSEYDSGIATAIAEYNIRCGGSKHLHQQASLIGHLRRIGAISSSRNNNNNNNNNSSNNHKNDSGGGGGGVVSRDNNNNATASAAASDGDDDGDATTTTTTTTLLEVGAGRGMLGLIAAGVNNTSAHATNDAKSPTTTTNLIMIEKVGSRGKADTVLRKASTCKTSSNYMNLSADRVSTSSSGSSSSDAMGTTAGTGTTTTTKTLNWSRLYCDLSHFGMKKLFEQTDVLNNNDNQRQGSGFNQQQQQKVVVIAKHLCGVGTDLALKSLEPIKEKISACIMATCCHGVCVWEDYVGRDYLHNVMVGASGDNSKAGLPNFGREEFELLRRWSSGTVSTRHNDKIDASTTTSTSACADCEEDDSDHPGAESSSFGCQEVSDEVASLGIANVLASLLRTDTTDSKTLLTVNGLGRACQRLIDYGRREYIIQSLSARQADLIYYVPEDITPQNAALVATWCPGEK